MSGVSPHGPRRRRRGLAGFTLLEVMIAMAILVMALVALLGHEGVAIQMSDFSNRLGQASFLAQSKMLDMEHLLIKESMDQIDGCESGDFRSEGFRQFKWKACGYKLELAEGSTDAMVEQFMSLLGGFGMDGAPDGAAGGAAAGLAGMAPGGMNPADLLRANIGMAVGAIPTFLQQLEDQIRKVRVEVTWRDTVAERRVVVERFVTTLGSDPNNAPPPEDGLAADDLNELLR